MKKILIVITCVALLSSLFCVCTIGATSTSSRLIDGADILTPLEEDSLAGELRLVSEERGFDIVILTVDTIGSTAPLTYANNYYDNNNYAPDGILLLVSMEERDWAVSTTGLCMSVFPDSRIDRIMDDTLGELSRGNYYASFSTFVSLCDQFAEQYEVSGSAETDHQDGLTLSNRILISIGIGLLVGIAVALILKQQLKSVAPVPHAQNYIKNVRVDHEKSRDVFLYSTTRKIPKQRSSGGSSGSRSSGSRHGGRRGKF